MIDWLSFRAPLSWSEPIHGGRLVRLKQCGAIDWDVPQRLALEGSFASSLTVRSVERGFLEVSGNPAKWFQGHNLWGTDDVAGLVRETMHRVCELLSLDPSPDDRAAWLRGDVALSRVDVTSMFELDTRDDVLEWLRAADQVATVKWRGKAHYDPGTITFGKAAKGQRAKAWQVVMYSKGTEIRLPGHHVNPYIPVAPQLFEWAQNKLRIELRLRTVELKRLGLSSVCDWISTDPMEVQALYLAKIEMAEQQMTHIDIEEGLKPRQRAAYALWKTGADLKSVYPRNTFYRYRRELLEAIDVDIATRANVSNVVPLVRVLEARPAPVPDWGTVAMFTPRPRFALAS